MTEIERKFPQIYHKFQAKDKNGDTLVNYFVQDAPEDRFNDIVEFMLKYFLPYEAMSESLKMVENQEALAHIREKWGSILKSKVTLVCFKENCDDIIGANILLINEPEKEPSSMSEIPGLRNLIAVMDFSEQQFNVFEHYKVNKYLYGFGLAVNPDYRGRGIATEILKARFPMLKSLNLTLTSTAFTGAFSQSAARNAGFHEDYVIEYDDIPNHLPGVSFPGIKHKYFKVMSYQLKN